MNGQSFMTRSNGGIVNNDQVAITTQTPAVTSLNDVHNFEKLAHFNRERIPERVVHAKGAGAFGVFTLTNDMSRYTCADVFNCVGKTTEVITRFSTVAGEKGSSDTRRDPRGFAVRFYTRDGNYDIVGNNTPVFFIRDAIKFPDFIHTQKRNPLTNLPDPDANWDFFSLTPESMFQVTRVYSDLGTPNGFRHMDGFGTNTFMWHNVCGEYFWVKYHWKTRQGVKNFTAAEAEQIGGANPDYATQDLYDNIKRGNFPQWELYVQILTPQQANDYRYNIFDTTKIIYEEDYPLIPVGVMTLNKVPDNFFNDVEQAAFCPGNLVTGVALSPDKMLNARAVFYADAQRYRIGANFMQLPVNQPKNKVTNYQRDGAMNTDYAASPNYYPNSFGGPVPNPIVTPPAYDASGLVTNNPEPVTPIDYEQPRRFYEEFSETEKQHLVNNIIDSLSQAQKRIQYRQAAVFYLVSEDYGTRVACALDLNIDTVKCLAEMTLQERERATMA